MRYNDNSQLIGRILHTPGDNRKYILEPPTNGMSSYINLVCIGEPAVNSPNYEVSNIVTGKKRDDWKIIEQEYELY